MIPVIIWKQFQKNDRDHDGPVALRRTAHYTYSSRIGDPAGLASPSRTLRARASLMTSTDRRSPRLAASGFLQAAEVLYRCGRG